MTVTPQTKAAWEGALKEDYLPVIREQFAYERVLDTVLEQNTDDVEGLEAVIAVRMNPNLGIGYRAENVALPDNGGQVIKKVRVPMKYLYGGVSFSGPLIAASRTDSGSYARIMQDEMENLVKDLRKVSNFYNYGDGSGVIARVVSVTTHTLIVDRHSSLFEDARVLDAWTAKTGGSQTMNGKAIVSYDQDTLTLTITSHGITTQDYLYLEDTRNECQMGLMGAIDDGTFTSTFQSLVRATYPRWNSKVLGNGGTNRTMTEKLAMDALAVARSKSVSPDMFIGTPFQLNDLAQELQGQRQFVNPTQKLAGGIRAVDIGGIAFTEDPDCPPGYCFLITKKDLSFFTSGPLDWMDKDGNILQRSLDRKDAYEATLFMYRELGAYRCNSSFRLEDIAENRPT